MSTCLVVYKSGRGMTPAAWRLNGPKNGSYAFRTPPTLLFFALFIIYFSSLSTLVDMAISSWTAVGQGAVLRAMGLGVSVAVPIKECPRHYGISGSEIWNKWRHPNQEPVRDSIHGQLVAADRITWLVRKGDLILPNKPIEVTRRVSCAFKNHLGWPNTAKLCFCGTVMTEAPSTLSDLSAGKKDAT